MSACASVTVTVIGSTLRISVRQLFETHSPHASILIADARNLLGSASTYAPKAPCSLIDGATSASVSRRLGTRLSYPRLSPWREFRRPSQLVAENVRIAAYLKNLESTSFGTRLDGIWGWPRIPKEVEL